MSYRYGITGFVKLHNKLAKKYVELNDLYWLKEYAVLLYIWPFTTSNIIKYNNINFVRTKGPKDTTEKQYCEITFPRYRTLLSDIKICKESDIIQIILDILSAIKLMHEHNIIHRDIKPNNILLDDNRAIIIDFSHSIRIRSDNIILEKQIATYSHRAPEVFKYKKNIVDKYDEKIDVWSAGIILIELITGIPFYNNISDGSYESMELLLKDKNCISKIKKYYYDKKLNFKYSNIYWDWIEKMLSYDYANRITAKNMYYEIYKFALCKNIEFIIPINENFIKKKYTEKIDTKYNKHLYNLCVNAATKYINKFKLFSQLSSIKNIIIFLLNKDAISYNNYPNMILSILFIIDTVIYDNMIHIDNYGFNENKIDNILKNIVHIICNFDRELFMYNLFNFNKNVSRSRMCINSIYKDNNCYNNCENNDSIYNLLPLSDGRIYIKKLINYD